MSDKTFCDGKTNEFVCKACGEREKFELPIHIKNLVSKGNEFDEKHKRCQEKGLEDAQSFRY